MAPSSSQSSEQEGPISKLRTAAAKNPATEELFDAGEQYVQAKLRNAVASAGDKLGQVTQKLAEPAEGGTSGTLLSAGSKLAEGKSPLRSAVEMGARSIKEKVSGLLSGGGGTGSAGKKAINIVEDIDVGVPLHEAYNQWTEFQEFSSFAKGVTSVEPTDEVTSNWKFKIFWSNRNMRATVTEQVPDERIAWSTDGSKGTIKGVVTFHPLGADLTKILLVIEYYPAGLFEKTGNIWRAQGRRARLDLKHFRRFITMEGGASGGWRGEIQDGEVVRSHDEVAEQEGGEADEESEEADEDYEDDEDYDRR